MTPTPPSAGIRRILVPLDGSQLSLSALEWADLIAGSCGASIELVRVISRPTVVAAETAPGMMPATAPAPYTDISEAIAAMRDAARGDLERASRGTNAPTEIRIIEGAPADAIVTHAEAGGFDLIVMGTRGEGGLKRLVLGSVTDAVIRSSSRPVLAVPAA